VAPEKAILSERKLRKIVGLTHICLVWMLLITEEPLFFAQWTRPHAEKGSVLYKTTQSDAPPEIVALVAGNNP
jgi:hypothetical protein